MKKSLVIRHELVKNKALDRTYHLQARIPRFPSILDNIPAAINYSFLSVTNKSTLGAGNLQDQKR